LNELTALIIAVPHLEYRGKAVDEFASKLIPTGCLINVKFMLDKQEAEENRIDFW